MNADWVPVARRIRAEATDDWNDKVAVDGSPARGGHFIRGLATITGPGEVTVATADGAARAFTARRGIVVATGTPTPPSTAP